MESRVDQQAARAGPARLSYEPNRALGYEPERKLPGDAEPALRSGSRHASREMNLGRVLGWLSIALGAGQVLAPHAFARATGMPHWLWLYRVIGARQIACGLGLLARPRSPAWRWARVAGDAMDVAALGAAVFSPAGRRRRLAATAAMAAGITAMDIRAGAASSETLPRLFDRAFAPARQAGR